MKQISLYTFLIVFFSLAMAGYFYLDERANQRRLMLKKGSPAQERVNKPSTTPKITKKSVEKEASEPPEADSFASLHKKKVEKATDIPKVLDEKQQVNKDIGEKSQFIPKPTEKPENIGAARWYKIFWNGFHVGDLFAEIKAIGGKQHSITAIIRSYGLAKLISKYSSDSMSIVQAKPGGRFTPVSFRTSLSIRKRSRDIFLKYAGNGAVIYETNHPPENRHKRKAVTESLKHGSYDPLSMILVVRQKVMEWMGNRENRFSIPVYDGRRRSELDFTVHGINKEGYIHLSFVEKPVEGYTNNELRHMKERKSTIHILLDQENFLPVEAEGDSLVGSAYGRLKMECPSLAACIKASRESKWSL